MGVMLPVLDHEQLDALGDDLGDVDFLRETVEMYLSELPGRKSLMQQAYTGTDLPGLVEIAHSLGSSSAMLGGAQLATACRAIEHRAATAEPGELAELMRVWDEACDRTDGAMREWVMRGWSGIETVTDPAHRRDVT